MSRARSSLGGRSHTEDGSSGRAVSHPSHIEQVMEGPDDDNEVANGKICMVALMLSKEDS